MKNLDRSLLPPDLDLERELLLLELERDLLLLFFLAFLDLINKERTNYFQDYLMTNNVHLINISSTQLTTISL